MCGINGFTWPDKELIDKMNETIEHRGPDDSGIYVSDEVSFGHVRLSIIDLTKRGHQPMEYEHNGKKLIITYNGEIYNFFEIRKYLESQGYAFKSKTDTEVILAAYMNLGPDCVKFFNGMWAFAIYDPENGKIFLSRDRLGIKPLYYYIDKYKFIFSSEVKAILLHDNLNISIRNESLIEYLMFRSTYGENTFIDNIKKLLPGNNMLFDLKTKELNIFEFWDVPIIDNEDDEHESIKRVEELMRKSIDRRMISDVPVGSILSGGLDSSISTAYMGETKKDLNTFTVRFKNSNFDEGEYATKVSNYLSTKHHEIWIDFDTFIDAMQKYASLKDEPIGVPNEIALFLLSKRIRDSGVYVVLSGEGSDEIFYGYNRIFRSPYDLERMQLISLYAETEKLMNRYEKLYNKYNGKLITKMEDLILYLYPYWKERDISKVIREKKDIQSIIKKTKDDIRKLVGRIPYDNYRKLSYFFIKLHLPILLNRVDNSTMMNAVETRVPFIDHELVEYVFNLPNYLKNPFKSIDEWKESIDMTSDEIAENKDIPKYILKKLAEKKIPSDIVWRKKIGFPIPFLEWKDRLIDYAKNILLSKESYLIKYFDLEGVQEVIAEILNSGNNYDIQRLWMLISLELWLRNWSDKICRQ